MQAKNKRVLHQLYSSTSPAFVTLERARTRVNLRVFSHSEKNTEIVCACTYEK